MKKIIYTFLAGFLVFPVFALAQWNVSDANTNANLPTGTITGIVTNIMKWLLALVGIVGIIGFAISGIMYFIAAGDDGKMGTAKSAMIYSIIGVIVALIGYVIIQAVDSLLGGKSTTF